MVTLEICELVMFPLIVRFTVEPFSVVAVMTVEFWAVGIVKLPVGEETVFEKLPSYTTGVGAGVGSGLGGGGRIAESEITETVPASQLLMNISPLAES